MHYIRFAASYTPPDHEEIHGCYWVAQWLHRNDFFTHQEWEVLQTEFEWFAEHLPIPSRLKKSRNPYAPPTGRCWFKETATGSVRHMQRIVNILQAHNVPVDRLVSKNPGMIIYEDRWQIVVE